MNTADQATMARVLSELREANYPKSYQVSRATFEAVENHLHHLQVEAYTEWREAGSPEVWPRQLWFLYSGPNFGLMLKGVELIAEFKTEHNP